MNMETSMGNGGGQLSVPPGFRFHPTEEELLYYYLRKKVSYEPIDLDVIREIDLNKLEPWELKEKCRIGSGPQNEWYFFSHKDKKYPTGTRTNRATAAGFWKATGRDKAIHLSSASKKIGLRKTLVFYTGRAPHGQKTDWIMHEYRLDDNDSDHVQEDGWVVCRVFKKKNHIRGFQQDFGHDPTEEPYLSHHHHHIATSSSPITHTLDHQSKHHHPLFYHDFNFDPHHNNHHHHLPQLFSPESAIAVANTAAPPFLPLNTTIDGIECSHNLLRLTSSHPPGGLVQQQHQERFSGGDWSFLDKLLASNHCQTKNVSSNDQVVVEQQLGVGVGIGGSASAAAAASSSSARLAFQYLGNEVDLLKFSK